MSAVKNKPGYQRCDQITVKTVPFTTRRLRDILDIDATVLEDGAVIVYDESTDTFKTQTLLEKQTLNGGNF
jgi:hypothetical protein